MLFAVSLSPLSCSFYPRFLWMPCSVWELQDARPLLFRVSVHNSGLSLGLYTSTGLHLCIHILEETKIPRFSFSKRILTRLSQSLPFAHLLRRLTCHFCSLGQWIEKERERPQRWDTGLELRLQSLGKVWGEYDMFQYFFKNRWLFYSSFKMFMEYKKRKTFQNYFAGLCSFDHSIVL